MKSGLFINGLSRTRKASSQTISPCSAGIRMANPTKASRATRTHLFLEWVANCSMTGFFSPETEPDKAIVSLFTLVRNNRAPCRRRKGAPHILGGKRNALRPVGRPETRVRNIRQSRVRVRGHLRQGVHGLRSVIIAKQILACIVKERV